MEMTKEEINKRTQQKVETIKTLCQQLFVEIVAKQAITKEGIIENVVLFSDREKYDLKKDEPKQDEKIADIRRPDSETGYGVRDSNVGGGKGALCSAGIKNDK